MDREREAALARDLLAREEVGLLTLTGPGGSGKTRLALHVAHDVEDKFADGVAWVPLASLRDPGLVASAIAGALGVREANREPLPETLKAALPDRRQLPEVEHLSQYAAVELFIRRARAAFDRRVEDARAHLDVAPFEVGWAAGQSISLQQALADALAGAQDPMERTSAG